MLWLTVVHTSEKVMCISLNMSCEAFPAPSYLFFLFFFFFRGVVGVCVMMRLIGECIVGNIRRKAQSRVGVSARCCPSYQENAG